MIGLPWYLKRKVGGGFKTWLFFALLTSLPILMAFWTIASGYSPRKNDKAKLPGKPIEHYLTFKTEDLREKYSGRSKIPIETFHELYFKGDVDLKGDCLDILELRHDWASFQFTMSLFWFFLTGMMPEVLMHTRSQGIFGHCSISTQLLTTFQTKSKFVTTMTVATISTDGS